MFTSLAELRQWHRTERSVFFRLLYQLSYEPSQAILAVAFWLWLEDSNNFRNICDLLTLAPGEVLDAIAKEAVFCMNSLGSDTPLRRDYLTSFITGRPVPWWRVQCSQNATVARAKYLIENVCALIFDDILYDFCRQEADDDELEVGYYEPIPVAGFPHPVFGEVRILRLHPWHEFPTERLWGFDW